MRNDRRLAVLLTLILAVTVQAGETPMPSFRDPVTDGVADPAMVWNRQENCWWMLYTQRRANIDLADVAYCYGNRIGVASTNDNGKSWAYRGTLDLEFERGLNTFWAPAVVFENGLYHLFITYVPGVHNHWAGTPRFHHYTSPDLWTWKHLGEVKLPETNGPIDATLLKTGDTWRMWYKQNNHTACAESDDLTSWRHVKTSTITDRDHEGEIAFRFAGHSWMIVDTWAGMAVYRAEQPVARPPDTWRYTNMILEGRSRRTDDGPSGAHGDVIVDETGGRAWIIYFTHPGRQKHTQNDMRPDGVIPYAHRRSSSLIAELKFEDGKLVAYRDGVEVNLPRQ